MASSLPAFPGFRFEAYCSLCELTLYSGKLPNPERDWDAAQIGILYEAHLKVCKAAEVLRKEPLEAIPA